MRPGIVTRKLYITKHAGSINSSKTIVKNGHCQFNFKIMPT